MLGPRIGAVKGRHAVLDSLWEATRGSAVSDRYRHYPFLEQLLIAQPVNLLKFYFIFTHGNILPDSSAGAVAKRSFVCPPNTIVIQTGADETCYLETSVGFDSPVRAMFAGPLETVLGTMQYLTGYGQHARHTNMDALLYTTPGEETLNKIVYITERELISRSGAAWGIYHGIPTAQGMTIPRDADPFLTKEFLILSSTGTFTEEETVAWLASMTTVPIACVFINCSSPDVYTRPVEDFRYSMELASRHTHHGAPQNVPAPVIAPTPEQIRASAQEVAAQNAALPGRLQADPSWKPRPITAPYEKPADVTRKPSTAEVWRTAQRRAVLNSKGEPIPYFGIRNTEAIEAVQDYYSTPTPGDKEPYPKYTAMDPKSLQKQWNRTAEASRGQPWDPDYEMDVGEEFSVPPQQSKGPAFFPPQLNESLARGPAGAGAGMEVDEEPKRRGGKNGRRTRRARRKHNVSSVPTPRSSRKPL